MGIKSIKEFEFKLHSGFESLYPKLMYEPERRELCLIKRRLAVINVIDPLSDYGYSYRNVHIDSKGMSVDDKLSDTATGGMGTDSPGYGYFTNEELDEMYFKFKKDKWTAKSMKPSHPHKTIFGDVIMRR